MIIIESHKTGDEAAGLATNTVLFIYSFTEIFDLPFFVLFFPASFTQFRDQGVRPAPRGAFRASGVRKWYFQTERGSNPEP